MQLDYLAVELPFKIELPTLGAQVQRALVDMADVWGVHVVFFIYRKSAENISITWKLPGVISRGGFACLALEANSPAFLRAFSRFWGDSFNDTAGIVVGDRRFGDQDSEGIEKACRMGDGGGCLLSFMHLGHGYSPVWTCCNATVRGLLPIGNLLVLQGHDNIWLCFVPTEPSRETSESLVSTLRDVGLSAEYESVQLA